MFGVKIIPTRGIERVNHHWRAKNKQHFLFAHAITNLAQVTIVDDIALLDIGLIWPDAGT